MKKKFFFLVLLFFICSVSFAGRKQGYRLFIWNLSQNDIVFFSSINAIILNPNPNIKYNSITFNGNDYNCSGINISIFRDILTVERDNHRILGELPFGSVNYDTFEYFYKYLLFFNTDGSLVRRIDDISQEMEIEANGNCSITITETAPIGSVPLNYPAIPESYCTDSYYITNNTDELVYVVAPDYIGVPHPDAGTLEEGDSLFIPSGPLTNGLNFYRALYPGESFYLGKEAHPASSSLSAAECFNEYLPLIYLVTPEMNVLYRLENFENYEFSEADSAEGKKVFLELQEEMSVRHSEYDKVDF